MLDDLKYIHTKDTMDALGIIEKQWQQLIHYYNVKVAHDSKILNIVQSGMGGSSWPLTYITSWPGVKAPLEISRDYTIPSYVNKHTLFIASSYSGNTEETLEALDRAEKTDALIVVITAGGILKERADKAGYSLFLIPSGIQPRMSSFYFIAAYIELFKQLELLSTVVSRVELEHLSHWLSLQVKSWRADTPTRDNPAKQLALEIVGKTPIIYSGKHLAPVAQKMKICFNESAKNTAWWNTYPEVSHNEFIGWSSHPIEKPFSVIDIASSFDHPRVKKRFAITTKMLSGLRPHPETIVAMGDTPEKQLFWTSMFCDFVATYTGLLNGIDPTPVMLVEKFKKELG
jgi:glucose/mannose-6-phosphate isomerase